ncbi:hypothetical protein DFJ74DRAFT_655687 [Hyaloraphidium curvatum]|nr:hypothetical protein DFJ74DRAFT_655687 [Hyaloraphidium curvatum]
MCRGRGKMPSTKARRPSRTAPMAGRRVRRPPPATCRRHPAKSASGRGRQIRRRPPRRNEPRPRRDGKRTTSSESRPHRFLANARVRNASAEPRALRRSRCPCPRAAPRPPTRGRRREEANGRGEGPHLPETPSGRKRSKCVLRISRWPRGRFRRARRSG